MEKDISNLNNIISKFYLSIKSDGYTVINNISDIDINIFEKQPLKLLYLEDNFKILMILVNVFISAIILYFAFKCILSLYSNTNIQNIYLFIIKLVIITILSINSFNICKEIINFNYIISNFVQEFLEEISNEKIEYIFLEDNISSLDDFFENADKVSLNGIKDLIVCSYIIFLSIFLSIRYVIILLCVIFSPFVMISLINDKTRVIFDYWIKIFILNLSIQTINKVLIFIPIISKREKDIYFAILIGSILIMYKINKYIGEVNLFGKNK